MTSTSLLGADFGNYYNPGNGGGISIEIGGNGQYGYTANTTVTFTNCDLQRNTALGAGNHAVVFQSYVFTLHPYCTKRNTRAYKDMLGIPHVFLCACLSCLLL